MLSQNIWKRVVGYVQDNIPPSNILQTLLYPARFYQNGQPDVAAWSIDEL